MECTINLTEAQVVALEVIGSNKDIQDVVQKIIDNLTDRQINTIVYSYVNDKLEAGQRIGFTNKDDLVISAKNEGYIENNIGYIHIAKI